ncbi:hypothetical protein ACFUEN_36125 [Streptomyces griseorubiginosus]|uniref:hypothetical protein n=1 Tax=Streptomyces griseorubiginosus TaxID=67304 RepID=UPI003638FFEA
MPKDRPWNRATYTRAAALDDLDLDNARDEEVRRYCLQRARAFLARAEDEESAINSRQQLEIASQYATIAQAFRRDPDLP